jgi:hypothetical protein
LYTPEPGSVAVGEVKTPEPGFTWVVVTVPDAFCGAT